MTTRWLGRAWRSLARCRSTNDEAAAWARAGAPHGAVVVADAQEGGRGRFGRVWHSPPGENLYFSTVVRPPLSPREAPPLTLATAVAVAEAIAEELGASGVVELKWPNDVLQGGRKVAGILAEMTSRTAPADRVDFVILGIGVNLNTLEFPEELADRATSLARGTGRAIDRDVFAASLCARLEIWHDRLVAEGPPPVVARWKSFARLFGRTVTVDNGRARVSGVAEDLDRDGALLLRREDGVVVRVVAGEVS